MPGADMGQIVNVTPQAFAFGAFIAEGAGSPWFKFFAVGINSVTRTGPGAYNINLTATFNHLMVPIVVFGTSTEAGWTAQVGATNLGVPSSVGIATYNTAFVQTDVPLGDSVLLVVVGS